MAGLLLAFGMLLAAQTVSELPVLVLPGGDRAWVLRVETSGGFTGRGSGNLTASSAGELACTGSAGCLPRLRSAARGSISELVSAVLLPATPPSSANQSSLCRDCVTITLTIERRDPEGERTARYTWDATTAARVPPEVRRLHAALVTLASSRAQ